MQAKLDLLVALQQILAELGLTWPEKALVEEPKEAAHGDLSSNVALLLGKQAKKAPKELALELCQKVLESVPFVAEASCAGPGFCNFTLAPSYWQGVLREIAEKGESYGQSELGAGQKVLVEFVSANPTGPLHVGHGRGAAVGDSLARLLKLVGYSVKTEYYVNDAGRQMKLLGLSVWLWVKKLSGKDVEWPEEYYKGDYIRVLAKEMLDKDPNLASKSEDEGREECYRYAMQSILAGIKSDLAEFRVVQDNFFSEKSLVDAKAVERAFAALDCSHLTYEQDQAYWFATKNLGDDRDRVLRKSDGSLTYFASDIAYHHDKYARGFDWLIDVWGADHHGYIPRMRAAITAMGREQSSFDVVLIQLVNLIKDGKPVSMSTRAGTFETLQDVVREVGVDASRFMFLSRKSDSPLDFDLDLVRQRNLENPVYYVQYAHARIRALERRASEQGLKVTFSPQVAARLTTFDDLTLLRKVAQVPELLQAAAKNLGVHHVSRYLSELAGLVHSYYVKYPVLGAEDEELGAARLLLLSSVGQVLRNLLWVLGVEAPEEM